MAHLAVGATLVPKCVLDADFVASGGASEVVVAHGDADAVDNLHLVVHVFDVGPALARVDREAGVLFVALVHIGLAHKVGHGVGAGGAELLIGALGRLEKHVAVAIAVQLGRRVAGRTHKVASLLVDC
eukprot:scaffold11920_cov108-Isochrysis_galbana.AAC.4